MFFVACSVRLEDSDVEDAELSDEDLDLIKALDEETKADDNQKDSDETSDEEANLG